MRGPVVIAGAGIAGCGLALALCRAGIGYVLCERRPDARATGAFLTLGPTGVRALRTLDAEDAVVDVSVPVRTLRVLDERENVQLSRPLSAAGTTTRLVGRGALTGALATRVAARGGDVRYGTAVVGAVADAGGVTVSLSDGSDVRGSILVGADGIGSAVRGLVDPDGRPPRPVGQRVYYGSTPARLLGEPGDFAALRFAGGAFGAFPRVDGTWWFVRRDVDDGAPPDSDRRAALERVVPEGAPARAVREADSIDAVDAYDLPHRGRWYSDRMVLVGDAAHAASPATGQGASMALEDVVVLGKALRDNDSAGAAAAAYERARRGRTQANVVASAAASRPDRPLPDVDPGERLRDDAVLAQLDWSVPQA